MKMVNKTKASHLPEGKEPLHLTVPTDVATAVRSRAACSRQRISTVATKLIKLGLKQEQNSN